MAWTVTITRVVDGDTVEARFPNGETDTLRLLGVDTPETSLDAVSPDEYEGFSETTAARDHLFNWGQKASAFARDELDGQTVRIEVDPQADRRGGFGRLLVYVIVDGENFNRRLLEQGYARMYDSPFTKRQAFTEVEATARANRVGLCGFLGESATSTATADAASDADLPPLPADSDYDRSASLQPSSDDMLQQSC
jgi:micrococcal nuclease